MQRSVGSTSVGVGRSARGPMSRREALANIMRTSLATMTLVGGAAALIAVASPARAEGACGLDYDCSADPSDSGCGEPEGSGPLYKDNHCDPSDSSCGMQDFSNTSR